MRFTVIFPLIALYVFMRGVYPLFRGKARWLAFVLFMAFALSPSASRWLCGPMFAPNLPAWWIVVGDFAQLVVLFCAFVAGVRDVLTLLLRPFGIRLNRWTGSRTIMFGAFALGALVTGVAEWYGMQKPVVRTERLVVEQLPEALEGLRIAHLSDIHVSGLFRADRTRDIVRLTNAAQPDLILITGDYVDGDPSDRGVDVADLGALKAPLGAWGCEGNHEHYVNYEGWKTFFRDNGIALLYNEHVVLTHNGEPFVVAGVTDSVAAKYGRPGPDVSKALQGAPDAFVILLAHQPKPASTYAAAGVDLMLSGHTHGGQMPVLDRAVSATNNGYVKGEYRVSPAVESTSFPTNEPNRSKMTLYVHEGTQVWNGFPLRLGTRNQITVLELVRAQKTQK